MMYLCSWLPHGVCNYANALIVDVSSDLDILQHEYTQEIELMNTYVTVTVIGYKTKCCRHHLK